MHNEKLTKQVCLFWRPETEAMMAATELVLPDLAAESAELDARVVGLSDADWSRSTPAPGWTIAHQIAHLAWTDQVALLSINDPDELRALGQRAFAQGPDYIDRAAADGATQPPSALLAGWRSGRAQLAAALPEVPDGRKLDWFGPPMSATSMATARLMETWAHGQDVADALGLAVTPTARLRHIARLAVRTRDFAYRVHDLAVPDEEFRIELTAPDGSAWTFGPEDAVQRVSGPAVDFCLLAAQRRHRDDLALVADGADARRWLTIMQVFAGPPGRGRQARES